MKNDRKKTLAVGQFKRLLFENLNYAVKSMVEDIPREEVLNASANYILDISNKVTELKDKYGMSDEDVKKIVIVICKEWDKEQMEKWKDLLEDEA